MVKSKIKPGNTLVSLQFLWKVRFRHARIIHSHNSFPVSFSSERLFRRQDNKAPSFSSSEPAWPSEVREVSIACSYDGTSQPALFWSPETGGPHPLLVALHTWSGDYRQIESLNYFQWCREQGLVFIHPNFRGPNFNPLACASEAAVNDVLDAVEYGKRTLWWTRSGYI